MRKIKQVVPLGNLKVGGENPIWVEAMARNHPGDLQAFARELIEVQKAGCEIFRVAVPDQRAVEGLAEMKKKSNMPLVADIHFNLELGIKCIKLGVDAVRINPGTIGSLGKLDRLISFTQEKGSTIRLGANTGSIPKKFSGKERVSALFDSMEEMVNFLESKKFNRIILSAKSTEVEETIEIYRKLDQSFSYPLHLGLTEAGEGWEGVVKSSLAVGTLLREGIGDNIRISLTNDNPVQETQVAWSILRSLNLRKRGIEIISCPTCARKKGNVVSLVKALREFFSWFPTSTPLKIAVMGCEVNGPGEAREADLGVAFSPRGLVLFSQGEILKIVGPEEMFIELIKLIRDKEVEGGTEP